MVNLDVGGVGASRLLSDSVSVPFLRGTGVLGNAFLVVEVTTVWVVSL